MSIYGVNNGVFSGLGKPTIKLEFEDNNALLDFQKRMSEQGGTAHPVEYKDGEFYPIEGNEIGFDIMRFYQQNAAPFVYMPLTENNIKAQFGEPQEIAIDGKKEKGYYLSSPIGTIILPYVQFKKLHKDNKRLRCFGVVRSTLIEPWIIKTYDWQNYIFQKSFKDNGNIIIFQCVVSDFKNIKNVVKSMYPPESKIKKTGGDHLWINPQTQQNRVNSLNGFARNTPYSVEFVEFPFAYITNIDKNYFVDGEKNSLGAPGDTYIITDTRKKPRKDLDEITALQKYKIAEVKDVRPIKFNGDFDFKTSLTSDGTYSFIELKDKYFDLWQNHLNAYLYNKYGNLVGHKEIKPLLEKDTDWQKLKQEFRDDMNFVNSLQGLGASGDVYLVTDTRTRTRKDLENTAALKKYDIRKLNGKELQKLKNNDPLLYEQIKSDLNGLGKMANPLIYNNLDILECRGMKPTYKILDSYDHFFKPATLKNTFSGFGLSDTKKLIADTCRKCWKDCKAIAAHLKDKDKLQSAFNLWHWLHHNIRYEYDKEGREEIRSPLRVWADRFRGVDCDCLSVFAWCVLKCMGYNPVFELAAFRGRPQFSHIYINLDGIVIDRVWFIFNSRPPLITKTELYKVELLNNLGQLF